MATIRPPQDVKEFLQFLNSKLVEYLLIGGYAVGYPRPTGGIDIWIAVHLQNVKRLVTALRAFGFDVVPDLPEELFLKGEQIVRIGFRRSESTSQQKFRALILKSASLNASSINSTASKSV